MFAGERVFAAKRRYSFNERFPITSRFEFKELEVGLPLLLEIAVDRYSPLLDDQYLFATLLDISKQVRREYDVSLTAISDLANQVDHPLSRRWIKPVCGLVKKYQARTVHDRLGQFGHLLHAQGIRPELSIASFTQTDVKERFVRPFEGQAGGEAGQLRH